MQNFAPAGLSAAHAGQITCRSVVAGAKGEIPTGLQGVCSKLQYTPMASPKPAPDLEALSAHEVLEYVVREHHPRLAVACSFQKEASVIVDMILRIEPN